MELFFHTFNALLIDTHQKRTQMKGKNNLLVLEFGIASMHDLKHSPVSVPCSLTIG